MLVLIHGGAYLRGSSASFGPNKLVGTHDMVLVTFNYRIGILGRSGYSYIGFNSKFIIIFSINFFGKSLL